MKILHFADLHLGVEAYGRLNPATGLSTRVEDCLGALDRLVDYAISQAVDLVVFAGDAYKTREPSQTHQREFARRIARLSESDVPVFLLIGNHDLPNAVGRATTTEIFDTLAVKNVYVSGRPDVFTINTRRGPLQVATLPWLRRSMLLSREEAQGVSVEEIKQQLEAALARMVAELASRIDPNLPSLLAAHVWVDGAKDGSEKPMTFGNDPRLMLSNIGKAFNYVALGHLHRHQVLSADPPVVYAGSLQKLDFGDEHDQKGFYEVEIDPAGTLGQRVSGFEFRPLEGRRFISLKVTAAEGEIDPTQTVLTFLENNAEIIKDNIIRLTIELPRELETSLRDAEIRALLKEAHYSLVNRKVTEETNPGLGTFSAETLSPLEALQTYLDYKKTPAKRQKVLLEHGKKLILDI
ncbi:exonuclease SbcCD subunit D [Chloroflexota bacterium]